MASENTVTLTGNVTRDPELKQVPSGSYVVEFGLAWNRRYQKDGVWESEPHYFDVVAWQDLAENVGASVHKGDRVTVSGRLTQESWEDKESGAKRSKVKVVADDVAPSLRWATASVTRNEKGEGGGGRPAARQQSRPAPQAEAFTGEEPF